MENTAIANTDETPKEVREKMCSQEVNEILKKYDCTIKIIFVLEENGSKMLFHKNIIANG